MNWIEIVTLRSSNGNVQEELIRELMKPVATGDESKGLIAMKIYLNARINGDVSIHLQWRSIKIEQQGSSIGLRLAETLKEFGLVNHSAWVEKRK
jgi:hypothetical protein